GRTEHTRNVSRPFRGGKGIGRFARDARGSDVDFADEMFAMIVALRYGCGVEGVRFDDIRTGFEVRIMNAAHGFGTRQAEDVVVALEIVRMITQALAAKRRLVQA